MKMTEAANHPISPGAYLACGAEASARLVRLERLILGDAHEIK